MPMHVAAEYGLIENLKFMITVEGDVHAREEVYTNTQTHTQTHSQCVRVYDFERVHVCFCVRPPFLQDGNTRMQVAARYGRIEAVKFMITVGGDVHAREKVYTHTQTHTH